MFVCRLLSMFPQSYYIFFAPQNFNRLLPLKSVNSCPEIIIFLLIVLIAAAGQAVILLLPIISHDFLSSPMAPIESYDSL